MLTLQDAKPFQRCGQGRNGRSFSRGSWARLRWWWFWLKKYHRLLKQACADRESFTEHLLALPATDVLLAGARLRDVEF